MKPALLALYHICRGAGEHPALLLKANVLEVIKDAMAQPYVEVQEAALQLMVSLLHTKSKQVLQSVLQGEALQHTLLPLREAASGPFSAEVQGTAIGVMRALVTECQQAKLDAVAQGAISLIVATMRRHSECSRLVQYGCSTLNVLYRQRAPEPCDIDPVVIGAVVNAGAVEVVRMALQQAPQDASLWNQATRLYLSLVNTDRLKQALKRVDDDMEEDEKAAVKGAATEALLRNKIVVARNLAMCSSLWGRAEGNMDGTAKLRWQDLKIQLEDIDVRPWEPALHSAPIWSTGHLHSHVVALLLAHTMSEPRAAPTADTYLSSQQYEKCSLRCRNRELHTLSMDMILALCRALADYQYHTSDGGSAVSGADHRH